MPGPPPNPHARRRNAGSGFTDLPATGWDAPPKLPPRKEEGRGWLKATRDAWDAWWRSPMASQWLEADATVLMAAIAYDEALRGSLDHAKEFRLLSDRLGLSSMSRLKHRWSLPAEAADAAGESDATVRKLSLVSG